MNGKRRDKKKKNENEPLRVLAKIMPTRFPLLRSLTTKHILRSRQAISYTKKYLARMHKQKALR